MRAVLLVGWRRLLNAHLGRGGGGVGRFFLVIVFQRVESKNRNVQNKLSVIRKTLQKEGVLN